jgi:hypothetical protein
VTALVDLSRAADDDAFEPALRILLAIIRKVNELTHAAADRRYADDRTRRRRLGPAKAWFLFNPRPWFSGCI